MYCQADIILHILWIAKHYSMFVENKYLVWFYYTSFVILVKPFTTNLGYYQICIAYILNRNALPQD